MNKLSFYIMRKKYKKQKITINHHVELNNVKLSEYVNIAHHAQISNSTIGKRTSIGRYTKIQFAELGKYCSVSWDVTIGALEHPIHSISTHAFPYRKQFGICSEDIQLEHKMVSIGNDVWIGCGVIILPGVKIGNGSIIGAGSVITHNVAPYEVVAGCPGKHIRWRFSSCIIDKLQELCWWDFSDEELKQYQEYFSPNRNIENDVSPLQVIVEHHDKKG